MDERTSTKVFYKTFNRQTVEEPENVQRDSESGAGSMTGVDQEIVDVILSGKVRPAFVSSFHRNDTNAASDEPS